MWTDVLHEELLAAAERGERLLLGQRDPRNRLHRRDGRAARDCSEGPPPLLRTSELLADLGDHDTALRSNRLCSWLLDIGFPVLSLVSRYGSATVAIAGWRSVTMAGRPHITNGDRAIGALDRQLNNLLGGHRPCRPPAPVNAGHGASGGPIASPETLERLGATPLRVGGRPVVGRRQTPVASTPLAHGGEHPLARPVALDRAGVAGLAVGVGVALAVARLGVGAAAAAHPLVAGLDRARLLPGRMPSVQKALASIPGGEDPACRRSPETSSSFA